MDILFNGVRSGRLLSERHDKMNNLAKNAQQGFIKHCPEGWACRSEVNLLPDNFESIMGYTSRADALLEKIDEKRRFWIEFEISRADPVANHVKFATAHIFHPQLETDIFVSMISSHVVRGRRNLASNTISLMRKLGMNAFQTVLLPNYIPDEIKKLNHTELASFENLDIDFDKEIRG